MGLLLFELILDFDKIVLFAQDLVGCIKPLTLLSELVLVLGPECVSCADLHGGKSCVFVRIHGHVLCFREDVFGYTDRNACLVDDLEVAVRDEYRHLQMLEEALIVLVERYEPAPDAALEDQHAAEAVDLRLIERPRQFEAFEYQCMYERQQHPSRDGTDKKYDRFLSVLAYGIEQEYRTCNQREDYPAVYCVEADAPCISVIAHVENGQVHCGNIDEMVDVIGQSKCSDRCGHCEDDPLDDIALFAVAVSQIDGSYQQERRHRDKRKEVEVSHEPVCGDRVHDQTVSDNFLQDV